MKRILWAYAEKFRMLVVRLGARKPEKGMEWFLGQAKCVEQTSVALERLYQGYRRRVGRFLVTREKRRSVHSMMFVCDVGLGGLARWLRAAGYVSFWREGAGDAELVEEARTKAAILLTTDSGILERRLLRKGIVLACWLSPGLTKLQQLEAVLLEFELPLLPSRCMECGGELKRVEKEQIEGIAPPKTYVWRNEFFVCQGCGKLLWHGTHWKRITQELTIASDRVDGGNKKEAVITHNLFGSSWGDK